MAEKKLTGKIASEHIRMMETPRPPEGIIEGSGHSEMLPVSFQT
jgi:hypothetical protein